MNRHFVEILSARCHKNLYGSTIEFFVQTDTKEVIPVSLSYEQLLVMLQDLALKLKRMGDNSGL